MLARFSDLNYCLEDSISTAEAFYVATMTKVPSEYRGGIHNRYPLRGLQFLQLEVFAQVSIVILLWCFPLVEWGNSYSRDGLRYMILNILMLFHV